MQLQTFEANDMSSALEKVRATMGDDAMIVRSRSVQKGGLFGLAKRSRVEVQAALNAPSRHASDAPQTEELWEGSPLAAPRAAPAADPLSERLQILDSKLDTLLLGLGTGTLRRPETAASHEGPEPLSNDNSIDALAQLAQQLPVCGALDLSVKPRVVAFVGPTGVGKTTMLLKLAGHYSLKEGRRVHIISADTFRLGAAEQLKAFARVFRLGLKIVLSPEETAEAIQEMDDQDLILIDTPGGSQRDAIHKSQVHAFLQAAAPAETHLVLAATARPGLIQECIREFASLEVNRLCFTKLDEAASLHEIFSAALGSGLPISYLGDGQTIPEDLEVASEENLAQAMIGTDISEG